MSLVSVETLKEYLQEFQGSSSADTELQNLLNRVETVVAEFLGFPKPSSSITTVSLSSTNYELYFDKPNYLNERVLQLNVKPVNSLTSIHADLDLEYDSSTEIDLTKVILDGETGKVILKPISSDSFPSGYRSIKVVCNAGYSSAPSNLEHAICVLASQLQRAKQNQGKETISQNGSSVKLTKNTIPDEVKQFLFPFRVPRSIL